jgi:hypothetical protein
MAIKTRVMIMKRNFISFPAQPKLLNLRAKRGISEIKRKEKIITSIIKTDGLLSNDKIGSEAELINILKGSFAELYFSIICSDINGKEQKKMAFAGVGKPIKESDCLGSLLNFANLIADKMVSIKAMYGT